MSLRFDATLKDIVTSRPEDFAAAFGLPRDEPVTALNVDLSTISAATDVALGFGDPLNEMADLNFQSGPDAGLPGRLHLYNAALHSRYGVSVRSIVVLLRPKADGTNLTGKLDYGDGKFRVEFGYGVIRLWQEPVESFLHGGLALLPLATLCEMPTDRDLPAALRDVIREIDRRLGVEANHAEAARLMTASYILSGLRLKRHELPAIFRGVGTMPEELTAYDEMLELEALSEARGLARGEARGLARGEARGRCLVLLLQGRKRFGSPDAETETEMRSLTDLDRLDRMADAILTVNSWEELLATP